MTAKPFLPPLPHDLEKLRTAAKRCQGCELYACAQNLVFGEGSSTARLMLVGEQPGRLEDETGLPFIGRAGKLLDSALEEAGITRAQVYITSAVKHYRHRGPRRAGVTPAGSHVTACRPWLEAQLQVIQPKVVLCMGRIAALSVLYRPVGVSASRNVCMNMDHYRVMVTFHPAGVIRMRNPEQRQARYVALVADLRQAWQLANC